MKKAKYIIMIILLGLLLLLLPNISNADVEVTRNVYSNNGSMKFNFTGLTLDMDHEYEFGLTKTAAAEVETWHSLTDYSATEATIDISTTTKDFREVINAVDKGYITIKDITSEENEKVLTAQPVDLKIPFLKVTNYTVISNGKNMDGEAEIKVPLRCVSNSTAYYQYEKITDENLIAKYKEIKEEKGDFNELETLLKKDVPSSNWTVWNYWNGYDSFTGMNGYGRTQRIISVPEDGLYYMWLFFSGKDVKNIYGCILVDNLQPEIALDSISLPQTKEVELGETLTLSVTFNPSNATNKIVTWSSSDETVATVDNAGKITPKKVGSTIITVTSQDGSKKAYCTVTVTEKTNEPSNEKPSTGDTNDEKDPTTANGQIPQTGVSMVAGISIVITLIALAIIYIKNRKYKDIK